MMNTSSKLSSASSESKSMKVKSASKSPGKMMNTQKPQAIAEGVYANGRLMHTMTSLVGNVAQVTLKDGTVHEGVLKTFSPKLDVALESVIEVDKSSASDRGCNITTILGSLSANKTLRDTMIFPMDNIVSLSMVDVDMDYPFKDGFKTDTEISGAKNVKAEKELVAWVDDDMPVPKRGSREDSLEPTNGQTGWSAHEMFMYNEQKNGVVGGFKGLDNVYTTAIDRSDPSYIEKERQAARIAQEIIDKGSSHKYLEDEDDNRDEGSRWSDVNRPKKDTYKDTRPPRNPLPPPSKPSDGPWRPISDRPKQIPNKLLSEPSQRPRTTNHGNNSKPVVDSHPHPDLSRKTSNSHNLRTPSKDVQPVQHDSTRPILSFADAVGQSDKNSNQSVTKRSTVTNDVSKPEPSNVRDSVAVQGHDKPGADETPKADAVLSKKSDSTINESVSSEAVVKTSKLNPNAKEFTLNPTAKPFTPKSHFSPPPAAQPLIANHPGVPSQQNVQPGQLAFQPHHHQQQHQQQHIHPHQQQQKQQQQQHHPHQHPSQQQQQYLVMNPSAPNMVMPHQQVIGPGGQPFQIINPVVVNQLSGNHNNNQYNPGYNSGGNQPSRKPHHGSRESRQGSGGHNRHENNSYNPHNVAAATGHPVLAGAPLTASGPLQFNHHHQGGPPGPGQQQGPGGQPMFSPMFVQGYPRMFQPQMINPYDPQYFMPLPMVQSAVQPQQQQQSNNGHHSTPSTPQSQTPSTPGLHGPSTPGPGGHAVIPQTPSPQQSAVMYQGQGMHGTFNPTMVMMQPSHPGLGPNPHIQGGQVIIPSSASGMTPGAQIPPHYNQNQPPPPPSQRPI